MKVQRDEYGQVLNRQLETERYGSGNSNDDDRGGTQPVQKDGNGMQLR